MNDIQADIRAELYRILEGLGAHPYLLATIGLWSEGRDEAEVLKLFRSWNDGTFRIALIRTTGEAPEPQRPKLRLVR
jgi:hypothetical protein